MNSSFKCVSVDASTTECYPYFTLFESSSTVKGLTNSFGDMFPSLGPVLLVALVVLLGTMILRGVEIWGMQK